MKRLMIALSLIVAVMFTACKSGKKKSDAKKLTIGYVEGWVAGVGMAHVTEELLEANGYDVELKQAAVDLIFTSMAQGDIDVFMDVWLPVTQKYKIPKYEGKIEKIVANYPNAKVGLVVPSYVDISSIEEMDDVKDKFDSKIVGIEAGAGLIAKTDKVIEEYGIDYELQISSGVAMTAELQKAIKENRWIVVTGWSPHWMFEKFDLKYLDDPKNIYGETERIETWSRKNFSADNEKLGTFFKNFVLTDEQMNSLLLYMSENKTDKKKAAKEWIKANKELTDSWLSTLK